MKKNSIRISAAVLAAILCVTNSGAVTALAAPTYENSFEQTSEETDENSFEQTSEETNENDFDESSENENDEKGLEESAEENCEDSENNEEVTEENSEENSEDDSEENSEENGEESDETEEESDVLPEGSSEELAEETSEETDDEIPVSLNYITLEELEEKREEAKEKLAELLQTRELAAVVFMVDSTDLYDSLEDKRVKTSLNISTTVLIDGVVSYKGDIFYHVCVRSDDELTGFVAAGDIYCPDEDFAKWEEEYAYLFRIDENLAKEGKCYYGNDELNGASSSICASNGLSKFPDNYSKYLKSVAEAHPNWKFTPVETKCDFNTSVANEKGNKSLVGSGSDPSWRDGPSSEGSGWYQAKEFIIRYYMDPRNFFDEKYIFQFDMLSYNENTANKEIVQAILSNSFMSGDIPNESISYADEFVKAGKSSQVTPYHLASRALQEQGRAGTSPLISGTYSGYEGYYNYFNIGASGSTNDTKYRNGLSRARSEGWNSRCKSIEGGAKFLREKYIGVGQDTLYFQKFNVVDGDFSHQYMQNLQAPCSESSTISSAFSSVGKLGLGYVFKIPVYAGIPDAPCPKQQYTLSLSTDDGSKNMQEHTEGKTLTVYLDGKTANAEKDSFTWTSSDTSVIEIMDEEGNEPTGGTVSLRAKRAGSATITVKYTGTQSGFKKKSAKITITVTGLYFSDGTEEEIDRYVLRSNISKTLQIVYKLPSGTKSKTPAYSSSDETVATVSSKGVVNTLTPGKTVISVSVGGMTKSADLYVYPGTFKTEEDISVEREETYQITTDFDRTVLPEEIKEEIAFTYESSNPGVAEVDENGLITAKAPGKTFMTVTMKNSIDSLGGISKCFAVYVPMHIVFAYDEPVTVSVNQGDTCDYEPEDIDNPDCYTLGWFTGEDGTGEKYIPGTVYLTDKIFYPYLSQKTEGVPQIAPLGSYTYTGSSIKPEVTVFDGDYVLEKGKDYTLSYSNNKSAKYSEKKRPLVTVKLKGNYSGTLKAYFDILPKNLNDKDISAPAVTSLYSGKKIKAKPTVYFGTKKLKLNKDYKLYYEDESEGKYTAEGTYKITARGIGNFAGELETSEIIVRKTAISKASLSLASSMPYTGKEICPGVKLTYKKVILTEGRDYTLSFTNNKEIGTAKVVIKGVGKYYGERSKTFKITGTSISKAKVFGIEKSYSFTGKEIVPEIKVITNYGKASSKELKLNEDYSVTISKNINAGTASVVIKGINSYTGTVKKSFKILPCDMKKENMLKDEINPFSTTIPECTFASKGAKPVPEITYNGYELVKGKDFTCTYKNNTGKKGTTPTVTIKGKGNFKNSYARTFTIKKQSLSNLNISVSDVLCNKKPGKFYSKPTVKDTDGGTLKADRDYRVKGYFYAKDTIVTNQAGESIERNAGDAVDKGDILNPDTEVEVILIAVMGSNCDGGAVTEDELPALTATYRVSKVNISKAKAQVGKCFYTGEEITLVPQDPLKSIGKPAEREIKVTYGKTTLEYGTDYVITGYSANVNKGTAYVYVKGIGNYCGTAKYKFTIGAKVLHL